MSEEQPRPIDLEIGPKEWADYEVVELPEEHVEAGEHLFLERIWRRRVSSGTWERHLVRFRVPTDTDLRLARADAKRIAVEDGIDQKEDAGLFENLDSGCLLWRCTYDPTPPYPRFAMDPRDLERRLKRVGCEQAWQKLEWIKRMVDPRPADIDGGEMIALSAAIAREQSIRPLFAYGGPSQASYIVTMAGLHIAFEAEKSSKASASPSPSATSTSSGSPGS